MTTRPLFHWKSSDCARAELMNHEWLVTNGLGGYSSSTITGVISRRYHGLLVAALAAPVGRMVVFNHISEFVQWGDGEWISLGDREGPIHPRPDGPEVLTSFHLEAGLPVWQYEAGGAVIEKRVRMLHRQNTVHVTYRLLGSPPVDQRPRLELRPAVVPEACVMTRGSTLVSSRTAGAPGGRISGSTILKSACCAMRLA